MDKLLLSVLALLLALVYTGCCKRNLLNTAVIESPLIFKGTVRRVGDSRMPGIIKPDRNTFIVDVTDPLSDPARGFNDQSVTVRVERDSRLRPSEINVGDELAFLVRPFVYADTLAVTGRIFKPSDEVLAAARRRTDLILQERLRLSELVVSGTVADITPYREVDESEHKPDWQQARIRIATTEKGRAPQSLDVVFPASRSFMWRLVPKLESNQTGIWLLQRARDLGMGRPPYAVLSPLDAQPPNELERIRRLLGKKREARAK